VKRPVAAKKLQKTPLGASRKRQRLKRKRRAIRGNAQCARCTPAPAPSIKESASAWLEFKLADGASTTTICPPIATTGAESNRITCGPEFAGGSLPTTPPPKAKSAAQQQKEELACAAHKKGRLLKRKAPKAEGLMTAFQVASLVHFIIIKKAAPSTSAQLNIINAGNHDVVIKPSLGTKKAAPPLNLNLRSALAPPAQKIITRR
jgi:hypothetical protein